jgi:hypothetical protein
MLSILKLQVRAESLPLLKQGLSTLHFTLSVFSELINLVLDVILFFGLKLIALLVFQAEAPEIDLADIE